MSKIFRIIRPKSLQDENYADYEYLIRWIGRDGADYVYMFYDAELEINIKSDSVNQDDAERVESIIESEERNVTLTANDLSKNDLVLIMQIMASKYVTRLLKDGTTERYAADAGNFKYRLMQGRYNIEFTLKRSNAEVWR